MSERDSSVGSSTRGGVSFDDLLRGVDENYCLDNVINLKTNTGARLPLSTAVDKISRHIKEIINGLETQSLADFKVTEFVVGKTTVGRKRKSVHRWKKFDPMDATTWNLGKNGPNKRWRGKYKKEGYNGLVALCSVTRDTVPPCSIDINQEDYTLVLEHNLIQHFAFGNDSRLGNKSFAPGQKATKGKTYAGVLYVAYKMDEDTCYSDESSDTSSLVDEHSSTENVD